MKDRLLTDPYIKTAKVSRKLPDKVVIEVAEREEYASVPYGDSFVIIDREGLVLRQTEVAPALPLLMGMTLTNMEPGTPLKVEETRIFSDTLRMRCV